MMIKQTIGALVVLLTGLNAAHATGGFNCGIDDDALKFSAESPLSRGLGSAIVNFKAEAEVRLAAAPQDFRKLTLDKTLVHSWVEGGELRLHIYYERGAGEPHASFELIVKTAAGKDGISYVGDYQLVMFSMDPPAGAEGKTLVVDGEVACSVE